MYAKLRGKLNACNEPLRLPQARRQINGQEKPTIDICSISVAAFRLNLKRKENTFFATSLFEIDRELEAHIPKDQTSEGISKDDQQPDEIEL